MQKRILNTITFLILAKGIQTIEKTWICNTNADDKNNWFGGDYMKNCTGFYFPRHFVDVCLMSIRKITTNAVYLPEDGDVELREFSEIVLSEDSDVCVMVKDDLKSRYFGDPQCWYNDNEAVPDIERPPCNDDDVVFPKDATYSVMQGPMFFTEKSYTIRGQRVGILDWLRLHISDDGCSEFTAVEGQGNYAGNKNWKVSNSCHKRNYYNAICKIRDFWREIVCTEPVYVFGHCTLFCGSVILVHPREHFDVGEFFDAFTRDQPMADAHYSIIDDQEKVYQITVTDRGGFTGDSISYARDFYEKIKSDPVAWGVKTIEANFSGYPLTPEKDLQNALGILFGTFFAVVLLFGLVFLFYVGPLQNLNIMQRIRLGEIKRRPPKPFVFARFENRDDGTTSMGGSIVSLDEAFDNPMYGHAMASTSGGAGMETVEEGEEIREDQPKFTSESTFSNPLYEKKDEDEVMEVTKE